MYFISDWMKPKIERYDDDEEVSFWGKALTSTVRTTGQVIEGNGEFRRSPSGNLVWERTEIHVSFGATTVCGEGVMRHWNVDPRKVKAIRLHVSDEDFEGAMRSKNRDRGDESSFGLMFLSLGAPLKLSQAKFVYWCVEMEMKEEKTK